MLAACNHPADARMLPQLRSGGESAPGGALRSERTSAVERLGSSTAIVAMEEAGRRSARSTVQPTNPSLEESQVENKKRLASLLAATAILFAACSSGGGAATSAPSAAAPSESASGAAPSESASAATGDPKTATSAAAAGGVDAVCAAGKEEGQVTLIATPANWANYGQMITDFQTKYGIKVQSDQPDT